MPIPAWLASRIRGIDSGPACMQRRRPAGAASFREVETALHRTQRLGVRDHGFVVLDLAAEAEGHFAEARALGRAGAAEGGRRSVVRMAGVVVLVALVLDGRVVRGNELQRGLVGQTGTGLDGEDLVHRLGIDHFDKDFTRLGVDGGGTVDALVHGVSVHRR